MPRRSKKPAHDTAPAAPASGCDWLGEVFTSKDLGPIVLKHVLTLEDLSAFTRTCTFLHQRPYTSDLRDSKGFVELGDKDPEWVTVNAAGLGRIRLLRFAHTNLHPVTVDCAIEAAVMGQYEVMDYLHEVECPMDARVASAAASKGRLQLLQSLHAKRFAIMDHTTVEAAARSGKVECLEFALKGVAKEICMRILDEESPPSPHSLADFARVIGANDAMVEAATVGSVACLDLLERCGATVGRDACIGAASKGHMDALKWTIERSGDMMPKGRGMSILLAAIAHGKMECVTHVFPLVRAYANEPLLCTNAIVHGKPRILDYLLEQGAPLPDSDAHLAISAPNRAPCLPVLHRRGYQFTSKHVRNAFLMENIAGVKVMVEKMGVPWFANVVSDAVLTKNVPGLRYALQRNLPIPKDILASAITTENRPIVELLVKTAHVRPWGEHMHACAELGYVDIARFLCAWMGKDWKRKAREYVVCHRDPKYQEFIRDVFG